MAHHIVAGTSRFFYLIVILYAALRASHLWGVYATKIIHQVALSGAYFLLNRISHIRSIVPSLAAMSLRWLLPTNSILEFSFRSLTFIDIPSCLLKRFH